ncbi:NADPH-dependent FMN reductase [Pelagibacterium limicola]|uniref:NADPH-dependent FMN reductase n=1 Tax=Pelagibacterium limicola TaxID=2791022 RepID=UPI0018AF7BF8|nr:NADPH-dependent FMN reductase [Pelagibacterium limicola]
MPTALTLSGSIRTGSFNQKLADIMGARLRAAGVEVTPVSLKDFEMPIFNEDLEPDNVPQTAIRLARLFVSHNIVFIATPEYNGGLPPLLVNALTWLSRVEPWPFESSVFGIGGVSSGKYGTIWAQSHLRDSLTKIGTLVVPTLLGIGPASSAFTEEGDIAEKAINRKIDRMIGELTHFSRGGV